MNAPAVPAQPLLRCFVRRHVAVDLEASRGARVPGLRLRTCLTGLARWDPDRQPPSRERR